MALSLANAVGYRKAPERRNILYHTGFFPGSSSGINLLSGTGHTAGVVAAPGFGATSVNNLHYGSGLSPGTNAASTKVFLTGINLTPQPSLSSGTIFSPVTSTISGLGSYPETKLSTAILPYGNSIYSGAVITPGISQSLERAVPSGTGYTPVVGTESEINRSSVNSQSSRINLPYTINTTPKTDLTSVIREPSGTKLASGSDSTTGTLFTSGTTPPYGYKLNSRTGLKSEEGFSIHQHNNNRAAINSGTSQYLGPTPSPAEDLPTGEQQGFGAGISSHNSQTFGINPTSGTGVNSDETNTASGTGISTGTKHTSRTVSSTETSLYSREPLRSENSLYAGAKYIPEIDQYTRSTLPYRTGVSSGIDLKTAQGISSQIDRPIYSPISQKNSVTGDRPVAVTVQQPSISPLSQVLGSVAFPSSVPVLTKLANPVPLPVPVVNAILLPVGVAPVGVSGAGVSIGSGSGRSLLSAKIAALGR
nr:uncharacterized protein LOC106681907 isoform X1 [Halyomorpha halys]